MNLREVLIGESRPSNETRLSEELDRERRQSAFLEESLSDLERSTTSDEGWRRLGAKFDTEFSRAGLKDIVTISRAMYMYHPLIRRSIKVTADYTWGQGATYKAEEESVQDIITAFMEDDDNQDILFGITSRVNMDISQMTDGSVFFRMVTNPVGDVQVRTIDCEEIEHIYTKSGDDQIPIYYERLWTEEELDLDTGVTKLVDRRAFYPDWRYWPDQRPDSIGGKPVMWDEPIIHQKSGGLRQMQFGVPEPFSVFEWARAYKKFLEDWHTLVASLSRFAWKVSTKGNRVKKIADKLTGRRRSEGSEPPHDPRVRETQGSAAVVDPDTDISPIPKTGATTSADDAKPSRLMVASGMNLPDTMLSMDPQQGALATAKTLDRPTELYIMGRQKMWATTDRKMFAYVCQAKQRRMLLAQDVNTNVEITFPPVLEADLKEQIGAIVSAATLDGKTEAATLPREMISQMLMERLGVDNIEEALKDLEGEVAEQVQQAEDSLGEALRGLGLR